MKPTTTLLLAGVALGGWFLFSKKKAKAASSPPVLGGDESSSHVVGPSGTPYALAFGESGAGGRLVSVNNSDFELLFTYVERPDGQRSLTARNAAADAAEVDLALTDFGFR